MTVLLPVQTALLFSHLAPPFASSHVSHLCALLALPTALAVAVTSLYCYLGPHTDGRVTYPAREPFGAHEELTLSKTPVRSGELKGGPGLTRESRLAAGLEMALLGLGCTLAPPLLGFFLAFCTVRPPIIFVEVASWDFELTDNGRTFRISGLHVSSARWFSFCLV